MSLLQKVFCSTLCFWILSVFVPPVGSATPGLRPGDIIFQKSQTQQSEAIREATGSDWSHVGILVQQGASWYVAEAVQPVKITPLRNWIARGKNKEFRIFRNPELTMKEASRLYQSIERFIGKNYDIYFEWSDDRIYCSEFVFKVFQEVTGSGVGEVQKVKELKLDGPYVRELIKARLSDLGRDLNLEEDIVTPISQMSDPDLIEIAQPAEFDLENDSFGNSSLTAH